MARTGYSVNYPMRWLKNPLLQFLVLGGLLFAIYAWLDDGRRDAITLSEAGLATLVQDFEALTGEPVGDTERQMLVDDYYRRELLFLEGLRQGIHRQDPAVRALIVERMQQQLSGELPAPDGRQLVNYYTDHMDRYYREASLSFEEFYSTTDPGDATMILDRLNQGLDVGERRDGWVYKQFPDYGDSMIRGLLGQATLQELRSLEPGRWQGPFASTDGWRLFRVQTKHPRQLLPFEQVRDQVLRDFQSDVLAERVRSFVEQRRDDYPLEQSR